MNTCKVLLLSLLIGASVTGVGADSTDNTAIAGRWLTESGNFEIDIAPCGSSWCGAVARVLANRSMSAPGQSMPVKDTQSLIGTQILSELAASGQGEWQGRIYNRENGKTYDCKVTAPTPQQLKIRAYVFLPLFGKTQLWTRAPNTTTAGANQ